ncbi:MAG: T9SS type A sorting domain-containing protein [Ignavibacteria bacterium]|nr:T9SS type A sorting domain-containing protein [Ignavibacteria bacterium]
MGSSFPSEKTGWFVGHYGRIYKTETGGEILTAVAAVSTPVVCRYDSLRLGVRVQEGVAPYSYSWMHGDATPINSSEILSGGGRNDSSVTLRADSVPTYRAVVSDSRGLVDTVLFTTSIRPLPIAQIREQVPGILEGLTDVPTSIANYQWHTIEGSTWQRLPLENKPTFRPIATGSYGVVVTNRSTGCSNASDPYAYIATSVEDVEASFPAELAVYPNPSSGMTHVALESRELKSLLLVDLHGNTIPITYSETGPSEVIFNTNSIAPGLYTLIVIKADGAAHCLFTVAR